MQRRGRRAGAIVVALGLLLGVFAGPPPATGAANQAGGGLVAGDDQYGQLAGAGTDSCEYLYGDAPCATRPEPVAGFGGGVIAVAAGTFHTLVARSDGTVWAWGNDASGQLGALGADRCGQYGQPCSRTPVRSGGLGGVTAVAADANYSLALKGDGTVWSWGDNGLGQLGTAPTNTACSPDRRDPVPCRLDPAPIAGLGHIKGIAAGYSHALAVQDDGTVWAWGTNGKGELGDGVTPYTAGWADNRPTPGQVVGLGDVVSVAAGQGFSLAVKNDGTVWAWGQNNYGQLGTGVVDDQNDPPFYDANPTPMPIGGLGRVVAVAAGAGHVVAQMADATVVTWGTNGFGELGLGFGSIAGCRCVPRPTPIPNFSGVTAVAAGSQFSLVAKGDGSGWGWGSNEYRQLGAPVTATCQPGSRSFRCNPSPSAMTGLTGVLTLAAGSTHSVALSATPTFADVPASYWAYPQIEQFAARGITTGCGLNAQGQKLYCPDRNVTRAEMAVFLVRAYP